LKALNYRGPTVQKRRRNKPQSYQHEKYATTHLQDSATASRRLLISSGVENDLVEAKVTNPPISNASFMIKSVFILKRLKAVCDRLERKLLSEQRGGSISEEVRFLRGFDF
jgi:hypothetical protein